MKKVYFLAGSLFLLASCSSSENKVQELQDHIIDSTVSARLAQRSAENAAKNDSILKAMESQKADTIEKERQGQKTNTSLKINNAPDTTHLQ